MSNVVELAGGGYEFYGESRSGNRGRERNRQGDVEALELAGELIPVGTAMAPAPQKGCKVPGVFIYDYSLCSLCGQCVRACPVDSLRFSQHVYYVGASRADFRLDLMARLARQAAEAPAPEAARPADATLMEEHP